MRRSATAFLPWLGCALSGIAIAATVWLGWSGRLALYIHPRYVVFSVIMAGVAAVFIAAAVVQSARERNHEHRHHHEEPDPDRAAAGGASLRRRGTAAVAGALALVALTFVVLLVIPPATLSSATAAQREINSGEAVNADVDLVTVGGDYLSFTVRDWARILGQVASPVFYEGKSVDVTGFVAADQSNPDNVYFVSRFVVTCCAVDAQPVGVPVFDPGWRDSLAEDDWVRVTGPFVPGAEVDVSTPIVVRPGAVIPVDEPADPYVY